MTSEIEDEEDDEEGRKELVPYSCGSGSQRSKKLSASIDVGIESWVREEHLATDPRCVTGEDANAHYNDDSCYHSQGGKDGRKTEGSQCDGLDNEQHGHLLPPQPLHVFLTLECSLIGGIGHLDVFAHDIFLRRRARRGTRLTEHGGRLGEWENGEKSVE